MSVRQDRAAELALEPRLTVVSGETGAGKSLTFQIPAKLLGGTVLDMRGEPLRYNTRETLLNPDFVKLAEAYGIRSMAVTQRSEVVPAVRAARQHDGPVLINFKVEQEDTVYPMVAAGAALRGDGG